jgi:WD40 repeat protein
LRVVATLRADFYDRPLRFQGFGSMVRDATVTVPAMGAAQLEATIRGPAERVGLEVEPPLVAELVAAVVDQPAATPSLQFTLYELAEQGDGRLDLAGYRRLGGVGGAIATRAENLYGSIGDGQDIVRHVFEQLVVIGPGGETTRRPTPRSDLAGLARGRGIDDVLDPWVQARLLSYDRHPETREPTVEVAHEALLREWPRLRGWVEADRAAIVAVGQLREAAASWEALDRDGDALYRGTKLETTVELLGARTNALPEAAGEFLDASRAARDQRRAREHERIAHQARTNRRLRRQLAALGVATIIAIVGGFVALDQRGQAQVEQRAAVARELAAASLAVVDEDPELSILLALEAVERTRRTEGTVLPAAESALHRAVTASRVVMSVPGLGGSVDWHPDGTVFVTEGPEDSGVVDLRDADTGESVLAFAGHDADINDVAFSADGSLLATAGDDGLVRVWDPDTGELQAELGGRGPAWGVSFSPDGSRVAAGWVEEGVVRTLDLTTRGGPLEVRAQTVPLADSSSFSPDGERLAIADAAGVVVVDAGTGDRLLEFQTGTNPFTEEVLAVRWSPDGRWIASGSRGLSTRVTDAETGDRHLTLDGHTHDVYRLDWSADGTRLATGARDGTARVWQITEGGAVEVVAVAAREGAVGGVAFSPDGERLLTGDVRVTAARIWDVGIAGGAEWANLPTATHVAGMAQFTPTGDALVMTGDGVPAVVWDLTTGEPRRRLGADEGEAWEVDVSP